MMRSGLALAKNVTAHSDGNYTSKQLVDSLKATIMDSASSYFGVTGNTTLNSAGDRVTGNYDYWKVVAKDIDRTHLFFLGILRSISKYADK